MCASIGARKDSCARSPLGCDRRSVIHLVVAATAKGGESHEATAVTGSAVLSEALIFSPNEVLAVDSFEPADGEMTSRHLLKMLDKRVVHGSAAQRADDRKRLRRDLLRHHHAKARRHQRDEAHEQRAAFLDDAALGDEA